MRKTIKMCQLEEREGKPIEAILQEYYERYGGTEASVRLGVEISTFHRWLHRLELVTQTNRKVLPRQD